MEVEMQILEESRPVPVLHRWNYKVIRRIALGRYCIVYWCRDLDINVDLIVKVITIPKEKRNEGVPSSILREISILKELRHANIVRLLGVLNNHYDIFLFFEQADLDLDNFIIKQTTYMDPLLVKKFLHQMLSATVYMHSRKILHRDLNPQNVLVFLSDEIVKLADVGSAKDYSVSPVLNTRYVGTLRYMAPEILLGSTEYSTACDMWSLGCIFAEMVTLRPLFTATNVLQALKGIFSLLGTPTEETWPGITSLCSYMDYIHPPTEPKDLTLKFTTLEPAGVDLLSKMLCKYPNGRISAEDALKHEFFN